MQTTKLKPLKSHGDKAADKAEMLEKSFAKFMSELSKPVKVKDAVMDIAELIPDDKVHSRKKHKSEKSKRSEKSHDAKPKNKHGKEHRSRRARDRLMELASLFPALAAQLDDQDDHHGRGRHQESTIVAQTIRDQLNPEDVSRLESVKEFYKVKFETEEKERKAKYQYLLNTQEFALRLLEPNTKKYYVTLALIASLKLKLAA